MRQKFMNFLLVFFDIIAIHLSFILAFAIRFDGDFVNGVQSAKYFDIYVKYALMFTLIKLISFYILGLYRSLWRYASIEELEQILVASFTANAAVLSYTFIIQQNLPRSIYILTFLWDMILIGGIRFSYR
ncbi:MAG TPA: polysaccharide biosynthesis protein, partial [Clostridiales bacterium]|nr:polysaccharide biosynthesis protein [Clostridiales bacterium]